MPAILKDEYMVRALHAERDLKEANRLILTMRQRCEQLCHGVFIATVIGFLVGAMFGAFFVANRFSATPNMDRLIERDALRARQGILP